MHLRNLIANLFDFSERPKTKGVGESDVPSEIVYRSVKGSPLTFVEVDAGTKYFVDKLDSIEKKLDKLLRTQRNRT